MRNAKLSDMIIGVIKLNAPKEMLSRVGLGEKVEQPK